MKQRWKTIVILIAALIWSLGCFASASEKDVSDFFAPFSENQPYYITDEPYILLVGNSFTQYNNYADILRKICRDRKIKAHIKVVATGKHSLYQYAFPSTEQEKKLTKRLKKQLNDVAYDYVVFQDRRHTPVRSPEKMYQAMEELSSMVHNNGAQMVLNMTWAPEEGAQEYGGLQMKARDRETYQRKVRDVYNAIGQQYQAAVAPSGLAFMRAEYIYPDIELYRVDLIHPNMAGSYLSACVLYATMFGRDPENITYYADVSAGGAAQDKRVCRKLQALAADVTIRSGLDITGAEVVLSEPEKVMKTGESAKIAYSIASAARGARVAGFSSDNTEVATVDSSGMVTAKTVGTANITVRLNNGKESACRVYVLQGGVSMGVGQTYALGFGEDVTWTVGQTEIAAVQDGAVKANKIGKTVLTGTTAAGTAIRLAVTVKGAPKKVQMAKSQTIYVGRTAKLGAKISSGVTAGGISYTSGNPDVAIVNEKGVVTGVSAGTTRVTATSYNGKKTVCRVKVIVPARKLSFSGASSVRKLKQGHTKKLRVTFTPKNTSVKTLKWKSSNPKVATVNQKGKVKALRRGKTVITATTTDGTKLHIKIRIKVV